MAERGSAGEAGGRDPGYEKTWWYWVAGGALYGIFLRVVFGFLPQVGGPMSMAFLLGTPFVVGALTIYGARHARPSVWSWIFTPWITVGLMLIGCGLALLEGAICIAILMPLFFVCSSVGGVAMGLALKVAGTGKSQLGAVAVLPFALVLGEAEVPLIERELEVRRAVEVAAPAHIIWNQILAARAIQPHELPVSLVHLIGVPKPLEGVNLVTPEGEVRYSTWERGVNFRAVVTERKEARSITWRYVFDPHSFPAGSMDEHVAIGGRYFDLRDTTFNLDPLPDGRTRLEIVAHYRVTSAINFYAVPAARLLGRDFVRMILELYRRRSERAVR